VLSVVKIFQESKVRTNFTGDLKKAAQLAHREKRLKRGRHELEQKLIRWGEDLRMIRKLKTGQYRLYSRKKDPKTGRRRNLGTFNTRKAAEAHERAVQFYKHR
jgi:hypothetical protein